MEPNEVIAFGLLRPDRFVRMVTEEGKPTWTEVNKPEETLCGYTARELQSLIEENTQLHETIKKLQEKVEALEPFEKLFMEYIKNGHSGASD